jgi:hypothetical protein
MPARLDSTLQNPTDQLLACRFQSLEHSWRQADEITIVGPSHFLSDLVTLKSSPPAVGDPRDRFG